MTVETCCWWNLLWARPFGKEDDLVTGDADVTIGWTGLLWVVQFSYGWCAREMLKGLAKREAMHVTLYVWEGFFLSFQVQSISLRQQCRASAMSCGLSERAERFGFVFEARVSTVTVRFFKWHANSFNNLICSVIHFILVWSWLQNESGAQLLLAFAAILVIQRKSGAMCTHAW